MGGELTSVQVLFCYLRYILFIGIKFVIYEGVNQKRSKTQEKNVCLFMSWVFLIRSITDSYLIAAITDSSTLNPKPSRSFGFRV